MSDKTMQCCGTQKNEITRTVPLQNVRPAVDILERDDAWLLVADLPGVSSDAIDLQIERGELRLEATQPTVGLNDNDGYILRERVPRRFVRVFRLGEGIDTDGIDANFEAGVLSVTLPKAVELQPRKIAVN